MVRRNKEILKYVLRQIFEISQKVGLNILPCHFYSEIPDLRELKRTNYWKQPYSMIGIRGVKTMSQFSFLQECCTKECIEKVTNYNIHAYGCKANGEEGYGPIEADFLYCFIYNKKPSRVIQIGSGVSTAVILLAAKDTGYSPDIICIDPYPTEFLIRLNKEKKIDLIQKKAQQIDIGILSNLGNNGLLFIDSTHSVKAGSEVNKIILEMLPRLNKGNWVHFHDIHFPYDYSRHILTNELFFSNETILLQSFLIHNRKYSLKASLSMLHYADPQRLKKLLPNYAPSGNSYGLKVSEGHFPSSAYLEAIE